jgi:ribosomal protein L24E
MHGVGKMDVKADGTYSYHCISKELNEIVSEHLLDATTLEM